MSESLESIYSKNWNYWKRGTLTAFSQQVSGKSYTAHPLALFLSGLVVYRKLPCSKAWEIQIAESEHKCHGLTLVEEKDNLLERRYTQVFEKIKNQCQACWKQKRPPGILGKYSTIRHIIKAERTFQQRWNFKSPETWRLAWVILKWSCPLNCKESFLKKGCSVNEAKAGKQGDCPSHLLMSNMLSHESGQLVWFGSLTESPVHLAWWAQHQALGWSKGIAAFCVFNSLSSKQFFFKRLLLKSHQQTDHAEFEEYTEWRGGKNPHKAQPQLFVTS